MVAELKKIYWMLLAPAIVLLVLAYGARQLGWVPHPRSGGLPAFIAPSVFVASVALSVALPVFLRSLFAHRMRNKKSVPEPDLFRFERKLLFAALSTPYLVPPAYLVGFPHFYFSAIVMTALYAVYYFFPSAKRIQYERRLFRTK
ncbi:MAG: hypothetical protein R6V84_07510 [Desulfobacterales bacterium]